MADQLQAEQKLSERLRFHAHKEARPFMHLLMNEAADELDRLALSSSQQVRDDALDEAAKLCDQKFQDRVASGYPREASMARALRDAIRALKSTPASPSQPSSVAMTDEPHPPTRQCMCEDCKPSFEELIHQAELSLDYRPEFRRAIANAHAALQSSPKGASTGMEPSEAESVIACLGEDAAKLEQENPGSEIAANMLAAARILEAKALPKDYQPSKWYDLRIDIDEGEVTTIRDFIGEEWGDPSAITLVVGDGASGYGLYVAQSEYLDEGSVFVTEMDRISLSSPQEASKPQDDLTMPCEGCDGFGYIGTIPATHFQPSEQIICDVCNGYGKYKVSASEFAASQPSAASNPQDERSLHEKMNMPPVSVENLTIRTKE